MSSGVAIIILNYNGWRDTINCLKSVYALEYENYHVILIDNGSTDHSIEKISEWITKAGLTLFIIEDHEILDGELKLRNIFERYSSLKANERIIVIKSKRNMGYSGGMNLGFQFIFNFLDKEYKIDHVLLLNNDTMVSKDLLKILTKVAVLSDRIGAVGPLVYEQETKKPVSVPQNDLPIPFSLILCKALKSSCISNILDSLRVLAVKKIEGSCYLVNVKAIEAVKGFDNLYYLYWEDTDLFKELAKRRYLVIYAPFTCAFHKVGSSSIRKKRVNPYATYFFCRNGIIYIYKHFYGIKKIFGLLYYIVFIAYYYIPILLLYFKNPSSAQNAVYGIVNGLKIISLCHKIKLCELRPL